MTRETIQFDGTPASFDRIRESLSRGPLPRIEVEDLALEFQNAADLEAFLSAAERGIRHSATETA